MAEPLMHAVIRTVPQNHTTTAPVCDEHCLRWGDLAHAHICPDGLFEEHPFLDVTAWCSCGVRLGEPVHLDTREEEDYRERMANAGMVFALVFKAHMKLSHNIDVDTNKRWQRALGTAA